jgi:hypothetical protein
MCPALRPCRLFTCRLLVYARTARAMASLIRVPEPGKRTDGAGYRDLIRFCITFLAGPLISRTVLIPAIGTAKQPLLVIAA